MNKYNNYGGGRKEKMDKISGPIRLKVFSNNERNIVLLGDEHFEKKNDCGSIRKKSRTEEEFACGKMCPFI